MELFEAILDMKQKCKAHVNKDVVLINHNLDVDVLHFKFICCEDEKCGFKQHNAAKKQKLVA